MEGQGYNFRRGARRGPCGIQRLGLHISSRLMLLPLEGQGNDRDERTKWGYKFFVLFV